MLIVFNRLIPTEKSLYIKAPPSPESAALGNSGDGVYSGEARPVRSRRGPVLLRPAGRQVARDGST